MLLSEQPVQGMEGICAWQKQVMGFLRVWSVDENQVPHEKKQTDPIYKKVLIFVPVTCAIGAISMRVCRVVGVQRFWSVCDSHVHHIHAESYR